jgi:predicted DNA-binding protein with PD1-like motif
LFEVYTFIEVKICSITTSQPFYNETLEIRKGWLSLSFRKEGNLIVFRFEDGKDLIESLKRVAKEHQIQSGVILSGIGMLRDFEIGFYSREKSGYVTNKFDEPVELLSLSGNISLCNNEIFFHLHAALAKEDKNAIGGHVQKATVHNTIEGVIIKFFEIKLMRDPETRVLSIS